MASPVDAGRATTALAASDPFTVNLPGSIAAGDLLLVFCRAAGANDFNLPSGWTWLLQNDNFDGVGDRSSVIYKVASGSEGATLSWDVTNAGTKGVALAWRITGAADPGTQVPQISSIALAGGTNPDPPSISPTGGSKDYLFIACCSCDGGANAVTAAPASYSNLQAIVSGTAGNFLEATAGGATRQVTTATENPGTFTKAGFPPNGGNAFTIAIHPGAAAGATYVPQIVVL